MRTVRRWITRTFLVLGIILLLGSGAVLALLGTGPGRQIIASQVGNLASNDQQQIELSGLNSVLGDRLNLDRIDLKDKSGIWGHATGLTIDYRLTSLLAGKIELDDIRLQSLTIERLPEAAKQTGQTQNSGWPTRLLPAHFNQADISQIAIERIQVGESIAGKAASFKLNGQANIANLPLSIAGNLSIEQIDGGRGALSASWQIEPDSNTAEIGVELNEPRDGVIVNALAIPNRPALAATINGRGPLANWLADLAVSFDQNEILSGQAKLAINDEAQSIDAQLNGQIAPFVPKTFLPLVAGKSDLNIRARRDTKGNIEIERAQLVSALANLSATGQINQTANRISIETVGNIGTPDAAIAFERVSGVTTELGATSFAGRIAGALNDAAVDINGKLESISEGAFSIAGAGFEIKSQNLNFVEPRGDILFSGEVAELVTPTAELNALLNGALLLNGKIKLQDNKANLLDVTLASDRIRAGVAGQYDLKDGAWQTAAAAKLKAAPKTIAYQLFGGEAGQISLEASQDAAGTIDAKTLKIESANITADFSGTISNELNLTGQARIADLSNLNTELSGAIVVGGKVSGMLADPQLDLQLSSEAVSVAQKPLVDLKGSITGSPNSLLLANADAIYDNTPISAIARVNMTDEGNRDVEQISLSMPGARLDGQINIANDGKLSGYADINFDDLSKIAPLILQPSLSGNSTGRVEFVVQDQKQQVTARLSAPKLTFGEIDLSELSLAANVDDLFGTAAPKATLKIGDASLYGERLVGSTLKLTNMENGWPIAITSSFNGKPLTLDANVRPQGDAFEIDINKVSLNYRDIAVALVQPASLRLQGNSIDVNVPQINVADGLVSINGRVDEQLKIDVGVDGVSLARLEDFAKTGMSPAGRISGTAQVTGDQSAPVVSYQVSARSLSAKPLRDAQLAALDAQGSGRLSGDTFSTNMQFSGNGLNLNLSGSTNVKTSALNFAVRGTAPFGYLAQPLSQTGTVLSGSADINATISGTPSAPNIQGQLSTSGARFTEIASRIRITNLNGVVDFNGDRATISQFSGQLGRNGRLSAKGEVSLRPNDNLNANIALSIRNGEYDDGSLISTIFDADLALNGPLSGTNNLSGTVNLGKTNVTIPDLLPNAVSAVAVTHKNANQQVNAQAQSIKPSTGGGGSSSTNLDVRVSAPNQIFVRGRGLDAELGGQFDVRGTTAKPIATGAINLIRGRMDILTKRFDFDFGRLVFAGPLIPTLDFAATTQQDGASYTIFVRGQASEPEFSFGSSAGVPQDQIVAKLFFGRGLTELSPLQLVQLANAIATLNGTGSQSGLLDRLRNVAGLDDVDIKTNDQGETAVGVGAYLNDRTYINIEKGAGSGSGKVTIDLNITDDITARGETSESGETKGGIFFERDY